MPSKLPARTKLSPRASLRSRLVPLALILALAQGSGMAQERELSAMGARQLLGWIQGVLKGEVPASARAPTLASEFDRAGSEVLVLSLFQDGRRIAGRSGQGKTLRQAALALIQTLGTGEALDRELAETHGLDLRVDRILNRRRFDPARSWRAQGFRPGEHGVLLRRGSRSSFLLPFELVRKGLFEGGQIQHPEILARLSAELGASSEPPIVEWIEVEAFRVGEDRSPERLRGLFPVASALTPERLQATGRDLAVQLARRLRSGRVPARTDLVTQRSQGSLEGKDLAEALAFLGEAQGHSTWGPGLGRVFRQGVAALSQNLRADQLSDGRRILTLKTKSDRGASLVEMARVIRVLALDQKARPRDRGARARLWRLGLAFLHMARPQGGWYPDWMAAVRGNPSWKFSAGAEAEALEALVEWVEAGAPAQAQAQLRQALARALLRLDEGGSLSPRELGSLARASLVLDQPRAAEKVLALALSWIDLQDLNPEGSRRAWGSFSSPPDLDTLTFSAEVARGLRFARLLAWRFGADPRGLDSALVKFGGYLLGLRVTPSEARVLPGAARVQGALMASSVDARIEWGSQGLALSALLGVQESLNQTAPTPRLAEWVDSIETLAGGG